MTSEQTRLVTDNMGLVGATIKRMRLHYDLDDLFGVGSLGLCKAAIHYIPGRLAFSTYASHIIRRDLITYLTKRTRQSPKDGRPDFSIEQFKEMDGNEPPDKINPYLQVEETEDIQMLIKTLDNILDADDAVLARLMLAGVTDAVVLAEQTGMSASTIRKARVRICKTIKAWMYGYVINDKPKAPGGHTRLRPKLQAKRDAEIMVLHKQGLSLREIGERLGMVRSTVNNAVQRCRQNEEL